MSFERMLKLTAFVLGILLLVAAANYWLDLGWFGDRPEAFVSWLVFLACIHLMIAFRHNATRRKRK